MPAFQGVQRACGLFYSASHASEHRTPFCGCKHLFQCSESQGGLQRSLQAPHTSWWAGTIQGKVVKSPFFPHCGHDPGDCVASLHSPLQICREALPESLRTAAVGSRVPDEPKILSPCLQLSLVPHAKWEWWLDRSSGVCWPCVLTDIRYHFPLEPTKTALSPQDLFHKQNLKKSPVGSNQRTTKATKTEIWHLFSLQWPTRCWHETHNKGMKVTDPSVSQRQIHPKKEKGRDKRNRTFTHFLQSATFPFPQHPFQF